MACPRRRPIIRRFRARVARSILRPTTPSSPGCCSDSPTPGLCPASRTTRRRWCAASAPRASAGSAIRDY
jgi:hypothetical protein